MSSPFPPQVSHPIFSKHKRLFHADGHNYQLEQSLYFTVELMYHQCVTRASLQVFPSLGAKMSFLIIV